MKNNLSVILAMKNLKIIDLYKATNIAKSTLTAMYYQRSNPKAETLVIIADYLDCSLDELLARKPFVVSG